MIYDVVDSSRVFRNRVEKNWRSRINVVWDMEDEKHFIEAAKQEGLVELQGHRSIGGCRASLYVPVPDEGVKKLRDFMEDYAIKK